MILTKILDVLAFFPRWANAGWEQGSRRAGIAKCAGLICLSPQYGNRRAACRSALSLMDEIENEYWQTSYAKAERHLHLAPSHACIWSLACPLSYLAR